MKTQIQWWALLLTGLALNACSTLNVCEIKNLDRVAFAPLRLAPDVEPTDLRVDVIRQTQQQKIGENTQTVDVPYGPLGFNLGNGLFYDLDENFSLRLDYLLGFTNHESFTLKKVRAGAVFGNGVEVYAYANDSLALTRNGQTRIRPLYHTEGPTDSLTYVGKNNFKYAIVERDSALVLRNRRKAKQMVVMEDEGHYYLQRRQEKENFSQQGNEINLRDRYLVALSDGNKTVTIYRLRRRGQRTVVVTIERNQHKVFIYNADYRGLALEFDGNSLTIYHNKTLVARYELEIPKKAGSALFTP